MNSKDAIPSINVDYFEDLTSGDVGQQPQSETENVGLRVAQLRREKGLSLEQSIHSLVPLCAFPAPWIRPFPA
jgi:hypothetical protein